MVDRPEMSGFATRERILDGARDAVARHGLEEGGFFVSVSHLYRYKRIELLIDACAKLEEAGRGVPLVLAGAPYDDAYTAELKALVKERGIDARFVGSLPADEVAGLMSGSLALAFSSEAENLPLTLLEAMAVGCAILTNRSCSMPEVCRDAALYVEEKTADDYARAMLRLLDDPELAKELRKRGLERARDFSWDTAADATLEVLREAGSRPKRRAHAQ